MDTMSDSNDMDARVAALGATIHEEGAAVAAAPAPHNFLSSSEEEEAPSQKGPPKKRKSGGRIAVRWKKTARRVSGEQETLSPGTANNLLEGRVNDLEAESEERKQQLELTEKSNKQAKQQVSLLNQEVKLLKGQLKLASAEEAAKEVSRLKAELAAVSDASVKATRVEGELSAEKATVKDLRTKLSKGMMAYDKLKGQYKQLKEDDNNAKASLKKEICTRKAEANDKEKKKKQDEAAVAAGQEAQKMAEYKLMLKMKGESQKADNKLADLEMKEKKRLNSLEIAASVSSRGDPLDLLDKPVCSSTRDGARGYGWSD